MRGTFGKVVLIALLLGGLVMTMSGRTLIDDARQIEERGMTVEADVTARRDAGVRRSGSQVLRYPAEIDISWEVDGTSYADTLVFDEPSASLMRAETLAIIVDPDVPQIAYFGPPDLELAGRTDLLVGIILLVATGGWAFLMWRSRPTIKQ